MTAHITICSVCNGARHYLVGDRAMFCPTCCPDRAEGQDRLKDCTSKHLNEAVAYWAEKRQVGYAVTLVGGPRRDQRTHMFFVMASSIASAIQTARNNNHGYVPTAGLRCTAIRLMCPCDSKGVTK